jgi:hypothetical protein
MHACIRVVTGEAVWVIWWICCAACQSPWLHPCMIQYGSVAFCVSILPSPKGRHRHAHVGLLCGASSGRLSLVVTVTADEDPLALTWRLSKFFFLCLHCLTHEAIVCAHHHHWKVFACGQVEKNWRRCHMKNQIKITSLIMEIVFFSDNRGS